MNPFRYIIRLLVVCVAVAGVALAANAHQARVIKVSGAAQVQLPGSSTSQALVPDMLVPEGALITTASDAQVFLEALPGVVATVEANSAVLVEKLVITKQGDKVTTQEAMLDLKKGNIVSTLDPAKKGVNRYGVRTPKGVAAARGTVYGVSVSITGTTVATLSGSVSINLGNGVFVDVPVGAAAVGDLTTTERISAAIAASGQAGLSVEQLLQQAVEAVAANVAANTSAAGGSDTATAVLAAVVSAASAAQPDKAAQFTQTAVAAASSSTSATGGNDAAIAAITEAAVRANPAAAAEISQSAAKAVVETKVTEAVNAAKESGASASEVAAAAASASQAASKTVQTIAQTAANTAASAGSPVTPAQIAAAVKTGSESGANEVTKATDVPVNPPSVELPQPADKSDQPPIIVTPPTPVDLPPVSPSSLL